MQAEAMRRTQLPTAGRDAPVPVLKLGMAAGGYGTALLLSHYLPLFSLLPWLGGLALLLGAGSQRFRFCRRRRVYLPLFAAAVGFLWTWGYTRLVIHPAEAHAGEVRVLSLRITEYPAAYENYTRIEARWAEAGMPRARLLIYDYGGGMEELCPGDLVEMPLELHSAGTQYGEESDYYYAEGIQLRGYRNGDYTVTGRDPLWWRYLPQRVVRFFGNQVLETYPAEVGPLMKALLTGDRKEYNQDEELSEAMRLAGFSHIVAVSGMHVAFLVTLLRLLMGNGRLLAFTGIPLLFFFMAMIGFSPSVTRAGLMQMLLLLAPLLRREPDGFSSLSFAALVILGRNPAAIGSAGFQLSFASVSGLILITPGIYRRLVFNEEQKLRFRRRSLPRYMLSWFGASLSASLGSMVFTLPLTAWRFGFVPVLGIFANLLCLNAMSLAFLCGYFVCLLGAAAPALGRAAGWLTGWLPRFARFVVLRLARFPFSVLYVSNPLVKVWLVFLYLLLGGVWILRRKEPERRPFRPVLPVFLALLSFGWTLLLLPKSCDGRLEVSAVDVGQGQCIAALTRRATVLIDCGSSSNGTDAGAAAAEFLLKDGRDRVDLLILTHFHSDHVNGVPNLLRRLRVERLAVAAEFEANEYSEAIFADCARYGTEIVPVAEDLLFRLDDLELLVFAPLRAGDPNEACLLIRGSYGAFDFLVTGDANTAVEEALATHWELGDMELLIAGHHGSRTATGEALLETVTPETVFISVGASNRYGHPAPEVLERLEARKIAVYRTDRDGTISLTTGG